MRRFVFAALACLAVVALAMPPPDLSFMAELATMSEPIDRLVGIGVFLVVLAAIQAARHGGGHRAVNLLLSLITAAGRAGSTRHPDPGWRRTATT